MLGRVPIGVLGFAPRGGGSNSHLVRCGVGLNASTPAPEVKWAAGGKVLPSQQEVKWAAAGGRIGLTPSNDGSERAVRGIVCSCMSGSAAVSGSSATVRR
jgi:hypothetical protein